MVCAIFQRDPHYNRKTKADFAVLMLVNLLLSVTVFRLISDITHVVDLHLSQ